MPRDVPQQQMPVHLRRHYLLCSEWWLHAGGCGLRRMPFDPHEFQPPRVIDFQHGLELVPQILVFLIALLGLAAYTTGCNSHDVFTV